jgi:hypothetical protein
VVAEVKSEARYYSNGGFSLPRCFVFQFGVLQFPAARNVIDSVDTWERIPNKPIHRSDMWSVMRHESCNGSHAE